MQYKYIYIYLYKQTNKNAMNLIEKNTTDLNGKKVFFEMEKLTDNILEINPFETIELESFVNGEGEQVESFLANQLTKNSYYSSKKILVSLEGLNVEIETLKNGKKIIFLNEDFYYTLKEVFNVKGKIFSSWKGDDKAIKILALCKHITDPYDIG